MQVTITYCAKCNFEPRVKLLTEAIRACGIEPDIQGVDRRGVFDVSVDGEVVFSREALGHLPRDKEVVSYLKLMQ